MRLGLIALCGAVALGGCSWFGGGSDKEAAPAAPAKATTMSEETLKRNCADPKWREQNLGLWYSVCRQPVRW